ncbi:MAG: PQQ-binding-like beta-propeller repeat protein [Phycisphaerae bacterium]|nr:PQQ-binding-like beta-propeller repeat protein [Phycisphaerae bacterium]
MYRTFLIVVAASLALSPVALAEANWPQFHGPSAGVAEDSVLPSAWSTTENVAWTLGIPGRAWSSPIVWGNRIFVTSAIGGRDAEKPKKGLYFGGNRDKPSDKTHLWMVYCIDFNSGKILWERLAHQAVPKRSLHIKNTYASETPVTDGERVFVYFGNIGLFCYDMDGKQLWTKEFGSFKTRYNWGTAASPALYKDWLFIVNDNDEQSFAVALGKMKGTQMWRVDRDEKSNWATPYIWENEKGTELITCGTGKIRSYDLEGNLLWELGGMSNIVIPTPFAKHGLLYISSGYVGDKKRPIFAIRPGARGDITLEEDQSSSEFIAWCQRQAGPYNPSPIVYGDYLYVLYDRGTLSCYDARTGGEVYSGQKIALEARAFTSSPLANNGRIFCLSEDGDTFVIQAGPEFKVLATNRLDEMCMATPAALRGSLIIRTMSKLYRVNARADDASTVRP